MAKNTEKKITAKFILDSTGFNSSIKGINSELRNAKSELKNASTEVGVFGRNSERLGDIQKSLARQVELHSKKVEVYKDSIEKTSSKMQDNIRARDKLKVSLDGANRKYDEAVKLYGKESEEAKKAKDEISKLEKEYKQKEKAVESNAKTIQNYETNMNKAKAQVTRTKGELENINAELDRSNNRWIKASKSLNETSQNLKTVGTGMSNAGDKVLKLSAPMIAAGAASTKFSMDFNKAMANVGTLIPGNIERLEELKGGVQDVGIMVGKSTDDIADGTYQVISAFGDTADTMKKVELNAKGAKAGLASTTDAINLSSAVMKGYGDVSAKSNEKVLDLAFNTTKLGQTTFPELAAAIGKVVPLSNELTISQEELFAVYATATGVTGTASEVSSQYRGVLQSLMAPTKDMTSLIKKMGYADGKALIKKEGLIGGIETIVKKARESGTPLQKYIGSIEGQTLALALAGEQNEVYKDKLDQMADSAGSMEEAFKQQTEGINEQGFTFEQAIIKMQVSAQKFGDTIAPMVGEGARIVGNLADKLGELDEEQMRNITRVGLLTLGIGGFLKIGGGAINTVGTITGGLGKLAGVMGKTKVATKGVTTATSAATTGIGSLGLASKIGTGLLGPWGIALGVATTAGVGLYKHLNKDVVPEVDLFNEKFIDSKTVVNEAGEAIQSADYKIVNFSESTKKAVGAYVKMNDEVQGIVNELYVNGTVMTEKTANTIVEKYTAMGESIKIGLDKDYKENYAIMEEFFNNSSTLTEEEEKEALESLVTHNSEKKKEIEDYIAKIIEITNKSVEDKREISTSEQEAIDKIRLEMQETAIKTLSETELESKVLMERIKAHSTRMSAEQASEIIKNANSQRDKAVAAAEDTYDKTVATAILMRDETGELTDEQADAVIKEADRQRREAIRKANQLRDGVVDELTEMTPEVEEQVDLQTGKIMTGWQKVKTWWDNLSFNTKVPKISPQYTAPKYSGSNRSSSSSRGYTGSKYSRIANRASGDSNFRGGLTTLHEKGYEVYDLPRGTRIYHHEASEDLVLKTAEAVARKVVSGNGGSKGINVTQNIYSPTPSPSEISRRTKNALRELSLGEW